MIINTTATTSPLYSARFRFIFWLSAVILFFGFLYLIKAILLPFVVGIMAAYFLDPAVQKLCRYRWPRSVAAGVITIGFFFVALLLCVLLAPRIAQQFSDLVTELPAYIDMLQDKYSDNIESYINSISTATQRGTVKSAVGNFTGTLLGAAGKLAGNVWTSGLALLNLLSLIFLTPVVAYYLLRDWQVITHRIDHLWPREHAAVIREQLHEINLTLSGFIRGQTNVCLLMAAYYGAALSIVGLKFGLGLGIISGFLLFVPFVGSAAGALFSIAAAMFQFGPHSALLEVAVIYLIGIMLEGGIIAPKLVGDKVGLHPIWIIFGMLCGGTLFGFVGVLLAVPVTAVTGVLVRFATDRYLKSPLYSGTPQIITSPVVVADPQNHPAITL